MQTTKKMSLTRLLLLISFASTNAVLFIAVLPSIANYFSITAIDQQTTTWFFLGYTLGQLIYGPLTNCFGRKSALYRGGLSRILNSDYRCMICFYTRSVYGLIRLLLVSRLLETKNRLSYDALHILSS